MVALRRESFTSEVQFRPHPLIAIIERPDFPEGSIIPLESFCDSPLTTRLRWKNPKPDYSFAEFLEGVGRNPKGNRSNTNIILSVLENHGVVNRRIPDNLIPVIDRALRDRVRDSSKTGKTLQDIYHESGHEAEPSSGQRKVIKSIGAKYGIRGRYWNVSLDTATVIISEYQQIVSTAKTRGWETRRANIAVHEQERQKHQREVEQNKETLTEIYETGYNRIVRFITVRIGNIDEAQEIASEVFLRAWKGIDSYKDTGAPMEAWLFKIARNHTINYINRDKNRRVGNIDDAPPLFSHDNPDDVLERSERAQSIKRVMKLLNPYQRRVLELRFWGDMTLNEVAAALGKTEGQIRAVQTRAIYRLRELMAESRELLSA